MTDTRPTREEIRDLAGRVASTAHPNLDDEIIDRAIDVVDDIDDRLDTDDRGTAVEDLLVFWDGYIYGGLLAVTGADSIDTETPRTEVVKRGNEADLFGLDLYQALLKLAEAEGDDPDDGSTVSDTTAMWAERVADLTTDFVGHLEDHK
ncbi:MAG: hypothetical protein ACOCSP_01910 [archaeon]